MGLRIQTNVAAMNAHRQLSISDAKMAKSLERLSSGYRINRAADDAAGLAIAGKLRVNNRSYVKASENTLQATALVQVAEGAMDQVENIINRLKELATQSASSTTDTDGRASLNAEFATLVEEIDRIANSTKYGGTQLINGNFGAEVESMSAVASMGISATSSVDVSAHIGEDGEIYTITDAGGGVLTLENNDSTVIQTLTLPAAGAQTVNFDKLGVKITLDDNYAFGELDGVTFTVANAAQVIQVGTTSDTNDRIGITMGNLDSDQNYGGIDALSAWSISTVSTAQDALNSIDAAIGFVTGKRAEIGAIQNRLGYAAANLATTIENTQAAESTIRDVDMAAEMTSFTKTQILLQAGTAMLAQANMAPQQVLALFV